MLVARFVETPVATENAPSNASVTQVELGDRDAKTSALRSKGYRVPIDSCRVRDSATSSARQENALRNWESMRLPIANRRFPRRHLPPLRPFLAPRSRVEVPESWRSGRGETASKAKETEGKREEKGEKTKEAVTVKRTWCRWKEAERLWKNQETSATKEIGARVEGSIEMVDEIELMKREKMVPVYGP